MSRRELALQHAAGAFAVLVIAIAAAASPGSGTPAIAAPVAVELGLQPSPTLAAVDLDIAALLVALGGIIAGGVGYSRLRAERPKIVEEIASSQESRLRAALDTAWEEVDRVRRVAEGYRAEVARCEARIDELERRERELETELVELRLRLES